VEKVAEVIQTEPIFTAKLFRIANSVMLKRGTEPLSDLKVIINRLGFDMIKNLSIALATRQMMNSKAYDALKPELRDLWEHSVKTAAIAYVLARDSKFASPDDALLAGLLHDIGAFYIYSRISSHPELLENRDSFKQILEDWHTGIGQAILQEWGFRAAIVVAVDEHETLETEHALRATLTDVIAVANLLARWGTADAKPVDLADVDALARLKLTPQSALESLEAMRGDIESIKSALS
jgi:putative nucleotidyltransferase with HDIG domain